MSPPYEHDNPLIKPQARHANRNSGPHAGLWMRCWYQGACPHPVPWSATLKPPGRPPSRHPSCSIPGSPSTTFLLWGGGGGVTVLLNLYQFFRNNGASPAPSYEGRANVQCRNQAKQPVKPNSLKGMQTLTRMLCEGMEVKQQALTCSRHFTNYRGLI